MNIFIEALENKSRIKDQISMLLSNEVIKLAESDWHAKRRPRHCGLTIHTGMGCPYQCSYCYIYSMGFPKKISLYPLPTLGIIYAILSNPYFIPGRNGTFLAIGSITEPFHPRIIEYTISVIRDISNYLGNPTQVSTKAYLNKEHIDDIKNANPKISILYTITTINHSHILEPYAPSPQKRFESIKILTGKNIHTSLFIRPIIPGLTDLENQNILMQGIASNVKRVVYGSLRVNEDILARLSKTLNYRIISGILNRIGGQGIGKKQIYIYSTDIKKRLVKEAMELGYKIYPSACSANVDSTGVSCYMCRMGPCGDISKLPTINESDLLELMEYLGIKLGKVSVEIGDRMIGIILRKIDYKKYGYELRNIIKTISKRDVVIRSDINKNSESIW